jgi:virulence factor Mce-like protein
VTAAAKVLAAIAAAAVAVAIVVIGSDGSPYKVRLELTNADGLRNGSQVKVGGVPVGTVSSLHLGSGDVVDVDVELDSGHHVGGDTTAEIVPSNLLGSTFVQLVPGRAPATEPSGSVIPSSRVTYPVQLDQVLNVLDADTRTRLGILINEAGIAVTGRRADFNQLLLLLPTDFNAGARMLGKVVSDNRTLASLIQHGDQLLARLTPQRDQLSQLVRTAGQTMQATKARRAELLRTLALAPDTLLSAQRFLAELRATALPLGPAARAITATAPELTATLSVLPAFQQAAAPALGEAVGVAPLLTRLGAQATPVVVRAAPTVAALSTFAGAAGPAFGALNVSIDDALGLVEGWARSIQGRDHIGHVFHGRALLGPEFARSLISQVAVHASRRSRGQHVRARVLAPVASPGGAQKSAGAVQSLAQNPAQVISGVLGNSGQNQNSASLKQLINYLTSP